MGKEKSSQSTTLYYDDTCSFCTRWVRLLEKYAALTDVLYQGLSDAPEGVKKLSRKNNAWVINRGGENFIGYAGFVECMKQSRVFGFYGYIGNIPPLRTVGNIIYRTIASRRKGCLLISNKK